MEHLKSMAISICSASLMFGIIKNILPSGKYEKHMRLILTLIFSILIFSGIREMALHQVFDFDTMQSERKDVTLEVQLQEHTKEYLNDQLKSLPYVAECTEVMIKGDGENYYISKISVSAESDKVIEFLKEITGLQEEQIYVGT